MQEGECFILFQIDGWRSDQRDAAVFSVLATKSNRISAKVINGARGDHQSDRAAPVVETDLVTVEPPEVPVR